MLTWIRQEFLEDRRVALEVALRRLAINAVRADSSVQADVRAFLGFPPCPGTGLLAGVDAEVARHLVRVPPQLELSLPERGPRPLSLLNNLRVTMWMLLSGAAHKVDGTQSPRLTSTQRLLRLWVFARVRGRCFRHTHIFACLLREL